jgi:probable F420-dependent oxidoreductase
MWPVVSALLRAFRFGVQATRTRDGASWAALARRAEALGYSTLTMPDHLGDQFAPVPALAAAAAATTTLRVGSLVLANDYRHPAVLAKEAATLDVLSGGRLELGLGAGWQRSEYDASGVTHDRAGVRLRRLVEAVAVIRGLMADGPFSFQGEHYRLTCLDGRPKPVQRPHPPFVMGGSKPRMLAIAGREADIVDINSSLGSDSPGPELVADMTPAGFHRKIGWVAEGAGARFPEIELHLLVVFVTVTDDRRAAAAAGGREYGLDAPLVLELPIVLMGTVDQMVEVLQRRRDAFGFSYVSVLDEAMERFAPVVERLAGA